MALSTENQYLNALGGTPWPKTDSNTNPVDGAIILTVYFDNDNSFTAWTPDEQSAFFGALHAWSSVANIHFLGVDNVDAADMSERKVTVVDPKDPAAVGSHNMPDQSTHIGRFDDSLFFPMTSPAALQPGGYTVEVFIHELGHAIGLAHPHDDVDGTQLFPGVDGMDANGNPIDIASDEGDNDLNGVLYTIMSYNEPPGSDPDKAVDRGFAATPMAFDIAAIQLLYGAVANNDGDTVYTLSDDMKSYSCIWDTSGTDTIQYNGNKNTTIELRAATLANAPGGGGFLSRVKDDAVFGGFTIAADITDFDHNGYLGVIIENAVGGSGKDRITGNEFNNRLEGRGGDDRLDGGGGFDTLIGGADNDTYILDDLSPFLIGGIPSGERYDAVQEDAGGGNDTIDVGAVLRLGALGALGFYTTSYTLSDNIENGVVIGDRDFNLTGNDLANILWGNAEANTLIGGANSDSLKGFGGFDTLIGGADDDTYILDDLSPFLIGGLPSGERYDAVQEDAGGGNDTIDVGAVLRLGALGALGFYTTSYTLSDNIENGVVIGDRDFNLTGNDLANTLWGNDEANTLIGGDNSDTLKGFGGFDTLIGGADNDTYILDDLSPFIIGGIPSGERYDAVQEDADGGFDTIDVGAVLRLGPLGALGFYTTSYTLSDNVENGVITGDKPFNLVGNDLRNILWGNAQANTLTGGLNRDMFVFGDGWGSDTVTDFTVGFTPSFGRPTGDILNMAEVTGLGSLSRLARTDTTDGVKLEFGGNSIVLAGITAGELTAANFDFIHRLSDGYISGATIFSDANGNGQLDTGETATTTDATGTFALTDPIGTLIAFGGVDTSTGLPLKCQLSAPQDSIDITPLTTLLVAGANPSQLLAGLSLPAGLDLTICDPIPALLAGDTDGAKVFVAGAKVMDTVIGIGTAIAGLGGIEAKAQQDAFAAIAGAVNNLGAGATLDLSDAATIAGLFASVAQLQDINAGQVAGAVGAAIAASNAVIDDKLESDGASDALITDVSAVQTVIQANQSPHAVGDFATATTGIGGTASADVAHGVLANDSDPDGDPLTVTGFTGGTHGTLVLDVDGSYSYTVTDLTGPTGSHLHDVFAYGITDGHAGVAIANLDITLNRAPIAVNDSIAVYKGGTVTGNVLTNDTDPDGDPIQTTSLVGGTFVATYGTLTFNADGSYGYVASKSGLPGNFVAQDTFRYSISDGDGGISSATLSVVVLNPSQSYQAGTNTTLTGGNGPDVLDGSSGHDILLGGNGPDVLIGGPGDTLTGGNNADTYLFRPGFGANTITDFDVNADVIQIDKSVFQTVADLLAHTSNTAAGAVIDDGAGDTITLAGVTLAQLQARTGDFHLVEQDVVTVDSSTGLLGQYMASTFPASASFTGGGLSSNAMADQPVLLAQPR